ncbi:uncharacterized protein LOC144884099 isoform X3 [Branchiostoma floridae x Branchiostoma japonicum]
MFPLKTQNGGRSGDRSQRGDSDREALLGASGSDVSNLTVDLNLFGQPKIQGRSHHRGATATMAGQENVRGKTLSRLCQYIGSFSVTHTNKVARADFVRKQLQAIEQVEKTQPVLLVLTLSGVRVCSPDGKTAHMDHSLKRISYCTCYPEERQFAFVARNPGQLFNDQYCHVFITRAQKEAEELNVIIGEAFKVAFSQQSEAGKQETFNQLVFERQQEFEGRFIHSRYSVNNKKATKEQEPAKRNWFGRSKRRAPSPPRATSPVATISPTFGEIQESIPKNGHVHIRIQQFETNHSSPKPVPKPRLHKPTNQGVAACQVMPSAPPVDACMNMATNQKAMMNMAANQKAMMNTHGLMNNQDYRGAAWYKGNVPREMAMAELERQCAGAFMVRESGSNPGCYALSLRTMAGISNYLIGKTDKGYTIMGFGKSFPDLHTLIIHYSVYAEMLPCRLRMTGNYDNPVPY